LQHLAGSSRTKILNIFGRRTNTTNDSQAPTQTRATQRTSARRQQNRVDLSRLEAPSLRKYRRIYKLGDLHNGGTKDELMPAVLRHWQQTVVDEDETLVAFAFALRKQATAGAGSGCNSNRIGIAVKKSATKPKK